MSQLITKVNQECYDPIIHQNISFDCKKFIIQEQISFNFNFTDRLILFFSMLGGTTILVLLVGLGLYLKTKNRVDYQSLH